MIWSKEDSNNLKILARNSTIIAKSLAKMAQLDDVEILESRPISGPVKRIEYSEYNPEREFEAELEELEQKREKVAETSNQLWVEDELPIEDL
jgi:hypothetical protein